MNVRVVLCALLATALAGCGDGEPAPPAPSGQIDGAVVDHLMQPYAKAKVHLVELDQWTETTPLGGFSFFQVPPGFHTVEVVIEGIGEDRQLVLVEVNESAKLILQVYNLPEPGPYVSDLAHRARVQLAQPGATCDECGWSAKLHEPPAAVVIAAVWDPTFAPGLETHVIMEAFDEHGHRILAPMGHAEEVEENGVTMLRSVLPGSAIPDDAHRISVVIKFDPKNDAPQVDFQMESFVSIHYGMSDETVALLG